MVAPRRNFNLSLYFVADPHFCAGRPVEDVVAAAADGGVTLVQLRNKVDSTSTILKQAETLLKVLQPYNIPLIINDYPDVAKKAGAQGVHLGQDDQDPMKARSLLGEDLIIGRTAYTEPQMKAVDPRIIDYVGTGPFYPTKTKPGKPVLGPEKFSALARRSLVLVVGIGGITPQNAKMVMKCGADGIAMMRSISEADDPKAAAQAFKKVLLS